MPLRATVEEYQDHILVPMVLWYRMRRGEVHPPRLDSPFNGVYATLI